MSTEERKPMKKVQCWISMEEWEKIESLGYTSPSVAVTKALEKLLADPNIDPDRSDKIHSQAAQLTELQDHNGTLKKELEDLKSMHNNYMMQMQTLINQKVIEAPGAKKPWWRFW
jgi:hypothetical protein